MDFSNAMDMWNNRTKGNKTKLGTTQMVDIRMVEPRNMLPTIRSQYPVVIFPISLKNNFDGNMDPLKCQFINQNLFTHGASWIFNWKTMA